MRWHQVAAARTNDKQTCCCKQIGHLHRSCAQIACSKPAGSHTTPRPEQQPFLHGLQRLLPLLTPQHGLVSSRSPTAAALPPPTTTATAAAASRAAPPLLHPLAPAAQQRWRPRPSSSSSTRPPPNRLNTWPWMTPPRQRCRPRRQRTSPRLRQQRRLRRPHRQQLHQQPRPARRRQRPTAQQAAQQAMMEVACCRPPRRR